MTNSVSFSEETAKKMEEGTVDEAVPTSAPIRSTGDKRLSQVSKMYDIDGDGELDEAEQAMRDMDKSGRGYLSNETVYKLMREQLQMQKSLFQMKKVIAGLLVFVVILALSNLGTSFASAILAKDTTTNSESGSPQLVDKKTGEVVATDQAVQRFTAEEPTSGQQNSRALNPTSLFGVTSSDFSSMTATDARDLLAVCAQGNKIVKLTYSTWTARTVCGNDWTCQSTFTYPADTRGNPNPTSGVLCLQGTIPMEYVHVNPSDSNDLSSPYIITSDDPDFLTSDLSEDCAVTDDCDDGLICSSNTCVVQPTTSPTKAPTPAPVPVLAEGAICAGEDTLDCAADLECMAKPSCSAGFSVQPLPPITCGLATSSTVASVDPCTANGFDFCNNNVCGRCDPTDATTVATTCPTSTRPACVVGSGGVYSCGCGEDADCNQSAGERCGAPNGTCVAGVSSYCSVNHDADFGCNPTVTTLTETQAGLGVSIATATCQAATDPYEPACDNDPSNYSCAGIGDILLAPNHGCSCIETYAPVCGYRDGVGIKYCNSCVAELNGAVWEAIVYKEGR